LYFKGVRRLSALLIAGSLAIASADAQRTVHLPPLDRALPARAEAIYADLATRVEAQSALDTVQFMAPLWRLAGNPAFDRSLDFIADRLKAGGFGATAAATLRVESFAASGQGWEQERATLAIDGASREIVLSKDQDRVTLCINSFSTPDGGLTLPLVDVGAGTNERDYAGKDVKGALVLGSGAVGPLWNRAVRERGAAGVVSSDAARYTRPEQTPDVLQWGSIPYDDTRRSFAFKATARAAGRLRERLAAGPVRVHVDIATRFHRGQNRTLIAEIPGTSRPAERVVLAAHVQEPGANDNASGSGTLLAAALALRAAVARGALPAPVRTITFMWLDEIRGSEQWLSEHPDEVKSVVAMMSLDMTGEDTSKTGGTFLIEKSPDPSAIWPRPSDPHSEWGAGTVARELVRGHFLNDLHLAICLRRARDNGWVVRTNPYEGGSDHTVYTRRGIAALLNWHFTDRYYHTNLDTVDKVSAAEMRNVAIAVGSTAMFVASATSADETALIALIEAAAQARFETERENNASDEIMSAWKVWYDEARASVRRLLAPI
jgi:hypothetical protein